MLRSLVGSEMCIRDRPGKGLVFNKDNTTTLPTPSNDDKFEGKVYFSGYLEKKGQHFLAGFSKRWFVLSYGHFRWYTSEASFDQEEEFLSEISTAAIADIMTVTSHPEAMDKGHMNILVDLDGSEDLREFKHEDEDNGWADIREWFKSFAAERSDRGGQPPAGDSLSLIHI
eukprot:TRINITY_DN3505_c0_g1_i2.p1 TRINITY_DN3505_c0_g1~~TRINITY_DN3505_c0_g1_i2.p1  ORF type:complete len:171 (+),score=60.69 TRINITY_DN3505_c0_g1_i2:140-652(+)